MSFDKLTVLLADNLHFHERNFASLFDFFKKNKINYEYSNVDKSWLSLYGNYVSKRKNLQIYYDLLNSLSLDDLYTFEVNGFNVYEIVRSELLTYLIPQDYWVNKSIKYNKELFLNIFENNKDDLLLNMASACYWFDFWENYLNSHKVYNYACIFSGCLTYTKVLINSLKTRVTDPLIFESSFTGNDYYCENHYGSIPNNTIIGFNNYFNNIKLDDNDIFSRKKLEHKAINKIRLMKNKNVEQPNVQESIVFENENPITLIVGQVVNDFSILESNLEEYNSIIIYKDVINKILEKTNHNIIFKAHPWECKKINIYKPLTKMQLENFIDTLSDSQKNRIKIVEDFNIGYLYSITKYFITLCSQSAIEAAYAGLKPIQLGNAFYGNKGFTYDVNSQNFVSILNTGNSNLDLNEFKNFNTFLIKYLINHLVSVHGSGLVSLKDIFSKYDRINLIQSVIQTKKENIGVNKPSITPPKEVKIDSVTDQDVRKNLIKENSQIVIDENSKFNFLDYMNKEGVNKKIEKFMNNPDKFFKDSKYVSIRKIGHIYGAIKQK